MENKFERQRRLSKELKKHLDILRMSDQLPKEIIRASIPDLKANRSLPLLSLRERRRASKQLKQDMLNEKNKALRIPDIITEQVITPQIKFLKIKPQPIEKSPQLKKYCLPSKGPTFIKPRRKETITSPKHKSKLVNTTLPGIGRNPYTEMFAKLVPKPKNNPVLTATNLILKPKAAEGPAKVLQVKPDRLDTRASLSTRGATKTWVRRVQS